MKTDWLFRVGQQGRQPQRGRSAKTRHCLNSHLTLIVQTSLQDGGAKFMQACPSFFHGQENISVLRRSG